MRLETLSLRPTRRKAPCCPLLLLASIILILLVLSTGDHHVVVDAFAATIPKIPSRVLIGYGSNVEKIRQAVVNGGVNVVIWSFVDFRRSENGQVVPKASVSLEEAAQLQTELNEKGFNHVLHLMSVGGWNGPHLDPLVSAEDWCQAFRDTNIFHGIDWDLEGNDNLSSIYNEFTMQTLTQMGEISRLLHQGE
jgi:hypothetical protein